MIATKQMDVRANIKKYFDMAFDGEPVIVSRKENKKAYLFPVIPHPVLCFVITGLSSLLSFYPESANREEGNLCPECYKKYVKLRNTK